MFQERIHLNNGTFIPLLGLGTFHLSPPNTHRAVAHAIQIGYRHIDTAAYYGNETEVGQAISESGIPREEIFVTTKLWNDDHDDPRGAFEASLQRLGLDYVDLYLIHWPVEQRIASWKALEKLDRSVCRAIGVSNFTIAHLSELLAAARNVPAVNQVEFSPFLYQKELLQFCQSKGIVLEGYCPLTRGRKFHDPRLQRMAKKYGKTPAQILIRWALQHHIVTIPKSSHPKRIEENADMDFSISEKDMQEMDRWNENFHVSWNPTALP